MKKLTCLECGEQFTVEPRRENSAKFCSSKCYNANRNSRSKVPCVGCGKEFCFRTKHPKKSGCCSWKCFSRVRRRNSLVSIKCTQCGKKFKIRKLILEKPRIRKASFFCSPKCRRLYRAKKKRCCLHCKKIFWVTAWAARSGGGKYCSQKCRGDYKKLHPPSHPRKEKRPCKNCGKPVERYLSQFKAGRGNFCSRECQWVQRSAKAEQERILVSCEQCGKKIRKTKSRIEISARLGRNFYCSRNCIKKAFQNKVERNCWVCGTVFEVVPSRGDAKYCSEKCLKWGNAAQASLLGRRRGVYTPELLNSLLQIDNPGTCKFPNCGMPRSSKAGEWACCDSHWKKVMRSIQGKRRRREHILQKLV